LLRWPPFEAAIHCASVQEILHPQTSKRSSLWVGFDQEQKVFGQSCTFCEVLLTLKALRSQDEIRRGNASQPRQSKVNSVAGAKGQICRQRISQLSTGCIAATNFSTPITTPAWRSTPSWVVVAGADRTINSDLERGYAVRANSRTIELEGASHSVYVSRPKEVAVLIEEAASHAQ
jgi:pimeloyl-ACP methyl ester carboxylesterase